MRPLLLRLAAATQLLHPTACQPEPVPPGDTTGGWLDLVYESTADGYDNHDPKPGFFARAQCRPSGGKILLRGNVQCVSGNQECWKDAAVSPGFATAPEPCRPSSLATSTPAKVNGDASGYSPAGPSLPLHIDTDGKMTLSAAAGDHWCLHLEGVSYSTGAWGLSLIITFLIVAVLYVGGGVGYAVRVQGAAPGLSAHPHTELWQQVQGLVVDGWRFTEARLKQQGEGGSLQEGLVQEEQGAGSASARPEDGGPAEDGRNSHGEEEDDEVIE